MKVTYKNTRPRARVYTNLAHIIRDINFLEIMIANDAKRYKSDLKIARQARDEFKRIHNL